MNAWRAIAFGALGWILIFFEVSILMFGFGLGANSGATYYIIHFILLAIIAALCSFLYFRGKSVKNKGFAQGLLVGLIFIITGIVLDAIITVPLFIKSYSFFANISLLIGYLWSIVICGVVGALKK